MSEITIKIRDDNTVAVEEIKSGIKSFKEIAPHSLLDCISKSMLRGTVSSGLLPNGCISYTAYDNGDKDVCIIHKENKADISYFGTEYKAFPLPRLIFGFNVNKEGHVKSCRLGVASNNDLLKPDTKMFYYPFSNVLGFNLCTGNNVIPRCKSIYTLSSLPYYILSMPNNNDYFKAENNRLGLEMRELLDLPKDKQPQFYYSNILISSGATVGDFINNSNY